MDCNEETCSFVLQKQITSPEEPNKTLPVCVGGWFVRENRKKAGTEKENIQSIKNNTALLRAN